MNLTRPAGRSADKDWSYIEPLALNDWDRMHHPTNRFPRSPLLALATLSIVLPGNALGQNPDFEWRGRLSAGGTIEVKGVSGDIRATLASGDEVEVVAMKRGDRRDVEAVTFEVVEHRDGITVCALFPQRRGRTTYCDPGSWRDLRLERDLDVEVDFDVRIPADGRFVARTISGDIDIQGLRSDVVAKTVSGDVWIETMGLAEARTVSGSVRATLGRIDWTGELAFETVSGDVIVEAPDGLEADVDFSTISGDIETDFAIAVRGRGFVRHNLRGTIGNGGRELRLKTVSGDVSLRRGR